MPEKMSTKSDSDKQGSTVTRKPHRKIILTLNNCLLPEEKLSQTPSRNDGLDDETETDLRIWGCELIQTAGILLRLPQVAMATGQVLFQRFYYCKSFARHSVETTAMACICLASKIEEAPRRIRDVINVFHHIKQIAEQKTIKPVVLDHSYVNLKTSVIKAERRVLKELGFCVHVKHPHKIIVMYLQVLSFEENTHMMQLAWNYMNDSLRTDVFVRYEPEVIACACIYLTARKLHIPLPMDPAWFTVFGAKEVDIKDICIRILRLYKRPKINISELEKKVEEVRKIYEEKKLKERALNEDKPSPKNKDSPKSADGSHNAWGGFISRSGNHNVANNHDKEKKRSRSRSISPVSGSKPRKRGRSRSRTRSRSKTRKMKKSRSRSRRRSHSKEHHVRNKQRDRSKNRRTSKSRSRSPLPTRKHKNNDRKSRYRSNSYDKYRDRSSPDKNSRYDKNDYDYPKNDKYNDYRSEKLSKKVSSYQIDDNDKYHDKYLSREGSLERSDHYHTESKLESRSKSKKDRRR
ncbi:cyclin-L2 [Chrysoperla carnea]|uniref:cyclin-L2 n=1 Tax=Chrysoperla carnea TaxID=189513 RepID=UPI001D05E7F7|nr:cyclin-L2 [Chrysoperla carnea]